MIRVMAKQELALQLAAAFVELIHTCELMNLTVAENESLQDELN